MTTIAFLFVAMSQAFNLPQGALSALCFTESNHDTEVTHYDDGNGNSIGICQIKLSTARLMGFRGSEDDLKNPSINILYAGAYLRRNMRRYNGDVYKAIASYNSGTYRPDPRDSRIARNSVYVNKVLIAWSMGR